MARLSYVWDGLIAAPTKTKRPICVVGFGRSGTSLTTRLLSLLGVELGPDEDLLPSRENDNPRGYWEPRWMNELNDEILAAVGGTWWQPLPAEAGWERRPLRERARAILNAKFAGKRRWGWKDPRTTLTLPFWRELVPDAEYVICLRNPADAIASIQRRPDPKLSTRAWGELWLEYTARALTETAGRPRCVVFYEDLLRDGEGELRRLASFVGSDDDDYERALATIETDLRHHAMSLTTLADSAAIPVEARMLYLGLRAAQDARRRAEGLESETAGLVVAAERFAQHAWGRAAEAAEMQGRIRALERELAEHRAELGRVRATYDAVVTSRSWRMTAPARSVMQRARDQRP